MASNDGDQKCARCHGYRYELNPDPSLSVPPFVPCRDCNNHDDPEG